MRYRLIVAIVITFLLIGLGIGEQVYLDYTFSQFEDKLSVLYEQETVDYEQVLDTGEWWAKTHKKLELTLPHLQLNEIAFVYGELEGAVKVGDEQTAKALIARLIANTKSLQEMFGFRLGNIF